MIVAGTFRKHEHVVDGFAAAIRDGALVWAGPINLCPLDDFEPGTDIYVNPALYGRIERAVQQVEKGIPYEPENAADERERGAEARRQAGDQSGET